MAASRIDFEQVLEEADTERLHKHADDLPADSAGRLIHSYIEQELEEYDLEVEKELEHGRADALDEYCVYEIKTKHPNVFDEHPPYRRDVEQVNKYLDSEDCPSDFGILVYLNRGDLDQNPQQYLVQGQGVSEL